MCLIPPNRFNHFVIRRKTVLQFHDFHDSTLPCLIITIVTIPSLLGTGSDFSLNETIQAYSNPEHKDRKQRGYTGRWEGEMTIAKKGLFQLCLHFPFVYRQIVLFHTIDRS